MNPFKPKQSQQRVRVSKTPQRAALNYYRSAEKPTDSPFEKKERQKARSRLMSKLADYLVASVIVVAIIYSLIVSPSPTLKLSSEAYHKAAVYHDAAVQQFSALKNRNKVTLNEQQIITNLKKSFPEISSGSIDLPIFGETPMLRLNIAKPSFVLNSQGIDYIVNTDGVAVGLAAGLPRIRGLPTVIDQTGFGVQKGIQILSAAEVNFVNNLITQTKHAKVPIASLTLPAKAQELDLRTSDRRYYIKFYLGGDSLLQVGQFLAARHQFDQNGQQPAQYLDVRVPGKIYYK